MRNITTTLIKSLCTAIALYALALNAYAEGNDFQQTTDKALTAGSPEAVLKALNKETYRGNLIAAQALGLMYRDGKMVTQDFDNARKFLKIAASTNLNRIWFRYGLVDAPYTLALMYQNGGGAKPDPSAAESWYEKAAQLGHAPSQLALAKMYFNGTGIKRDAERALFWSSVAATSLRDAELQESEHIRDEAQKQLDPKQLAKTRNTLNEWKPRKSS